MLDRSQRGQLVAAQEQLPLERRAVQRTAAEELDAQAVP